MNDDLITPPPASSFQSTQWSVVLRAGDLQSDGADAALSQLCSAYWYPIYAFVRRRGLDHHDAVDLTQGFFIRLLEKRAGLMTLSPEKGRFRAYLLAAVKNFIASHWRKEKAAQRGGRVTKISIDDEVVERRYRDQLAEECSPEVEFERSWARTLLAGVLTQLEADYDRAGKQALFQAIRPWLVARSDRLPQAEIARQLQISVPAVTMSIQRMRARYADIIREKIADTVSDPVDVDDELKQLMTAVAS